MKREKNKKKTTSAEQTDQQEEVLSSTKKPTKSTIVTTQKKSPDSKNKTVPTTESQESSSTTTDSSKISKKQTTKVDSKQKEEKTKPKASKTNTPVRKTKDTPSNSSNNKKDQQKSKQQEKGAIHSPIIDIKTLKKDELLSLLRSANEITPTCLKVTLISNHLPTKGSNSLEISSKKGDIVYLQYVSDGLCCIKTKKGKTGFIPFSKTSASLLLADSTPKTRRKLFGANKQRRKTSQDTTTTSPPPPTAIKQTTSILKDETDSVKTKRKERSISFDLPPEAGKKKLEKAKSVEPLKTDTLTRTRENGSPTITHRAPVQYFTELATGDYNKNNAEHKAFIKSGRSKSYDQILSPILKKTRTRLRDHSLEGLLATKDRSSSINASDEFIFQRPSTAQDRYRTPSSFEKRDLERPSTSLDNHYKRSGSSFGHYNSDRSFDLSDNERPSTALDRYRSSSFETDDQRSASALGRRSSKESLNSDISRQSSIDRALSPITQRKLKDFSNSDRDMNKLKAFSRKISSKTSLKDTSNKGPRKSSSSSRMSDSELSTSSYGSSIVKVNNKRNGSTNSSQGKHKRTGSLSENYHLNWYKDWNLEPSDSSDSEDEYTTTDTESIQVKVKKTIKQQDERSMSDYENRIGTNRLRYRRSSDVSASSEMYIPKPKQALGSEKNNNNNNTNISGFAQVYKTKSAMEKGKVKSSSSDALLGDKRSAEMEQKIAELRKNRLTLSNSSLNSVAFKNDKRQSRATTPTNEREQDNRERTVDDKLLSPLIPRKIGSGSDESDKNEQSVTDILLGKSAPEESTETTEQLKVGTNTVPNSESINAITNDKNDKNDIMIVKSDFIAQEDDYVTIFTCQHVEVLDRSEGEWWWIRSPNGKEGFVPRDFLMEKPKVPKRKPNASRIKRVSSPESDCNNNNSQSSLKMSMQQYKQNSQQPPLAKVAPLMRKVDPYSGERDDIALYKKQKQQQQEFNQFPPSYNQVIMSRQKSDLTDRFYSNKQQTLYGGGEEESIHAMHREREDNPGGAARIVRRRSFSGRQKKVRFASQVSSSDESPQQPKQLQKYQNSPGQILIVRQPIDTIESHEYMDKKPENEVEIATWC